MYLNRNIEQQIIEYISIFSVVGLTGPRQSGKSTLLKNLLPNYRYITFDDARLRQFYYDDPTGFLNEYNSNVIFDEVQKVPEIFESIKILVDENRSQYGRFILTGSSQFTLIKKITESLAGRIGLLSLLPFQLNEIPKGNQEVSIWRGTYPELVVRNYRGFEAWFSSYITTYIERDVRDLLQVGDLRDFHKLIELLAANCTQILNMSSLARDLGVTVQTVKRWLSILEASYIIFLLPSYFNNFGKRIIKAPKLYFWDTGLVSFITGITSNQLFEKGPMAGELFENFIIADIYKNILHHAKNAELYFLKTSHGQEIDLIIDYKNHLELIEIKLSATPNPKMIKVLKEFGSAKDKKQVIYRGDDFKIGDIKFINYTEYLGFKR